MKVCKKCNIKKELSLFNKNSNKEDGLHIWCKECSSSYNKKRYEIKKDTFSDPISIEFYQTVIKWIKPSHLKNISTYV